MQCHQTYRCIVNVKHLYQNIPGENGLLLGYSVLQRDQQLVYVSSYIAIC